MFNRITQITQEFPRNFWIVVAASFIDHVGGTLLYPFFALYITAKFEVGMTEAGILFGLFSISGFIGNMIGGVLTDRFGRRWMVLFGLVFSALSALVMGLVEQLEVFYALAVVVGLLSDAAGPAWQAMMADLLPEEKRTEGFGVLRVVGNLAWIVGPTIGGFMAARSYMSLFILDAITSLITAAIIFRMVPETKPEAPTDKAPETLAQTAVGYVRVLADKLYMAFVLVSVLMLLVYMQLYSTLSVYLRDVHGFSPQQYGFLMSCSAITVILFQFWVTRKVKDKPPMLMMAMGAFFYMIGFSMFGFVSPYWLFASAVVIITIGEMIVMPVAQALAANLAPEDMRGRYMAIFGLAWALPGTVGPTLAGIILDNYNPNWVWYFGGLICLAAVFGYLTLQPVVRRRFTLSEKALGTSEA